MRISREKARLDKLTRIIEANIRWQSLPYMRVIEPAPDGDDESAGSGQKRRRRRGALMNRRVHFPEPSPVTQIKYFEGSPNHKTAPRNTTTIATNELSTEEYDDFIYSEGFGISNVDADDASLDC